MVAEFSSDWAVCGNMFSILWSLMYPRWHIDNNPFPNLYVDLTERCNMDCNFCYNPERSKADLRIPVQTGHAFHGKLDSHSRANWTVK